MMGVLIGLELREFDKMCAMRLVFAVFYVAIFDVIQSEVALQKQVHLNHSLYLGKK